MILNKIRKIFGLRPRNKHLLKYRAAKYVHSYLRSNNAEDLKEINMGVRNFMLYLLSDEKRYLRFFRRLHENDKERGEFDVNRDYYRSTFNLSSIMHDYKEATLTIISREITKIRNMPVPSALKDKYIDMLHGIKWFLFNKNTHYHGKSNSKP